MDSRAARLTTRGNPFAPCIFRLESFSIPKRIPILIPKGFRNPFDLPFYFFGSHTKDLPYFYCPSFYLFVIICTPSFKKPQQQQQIDQLHNNNLYNNNNSNINTSHYTTILSRLYDDKRCTMAGGSRIH